MLHHTKSTSSNNKKDMINKLHTIKTASHLLAVLTLLVLPSLHAMDEGQPLLQMEELDQEEAEYDFSFDTTKKLEKANWFKRRRLLIQAAQAGHYTHVSKLLRLGTSSNVVDSWDYENTPLHFAAKNGYPQIAQLLLEHDDQTTCCFRRVKQRIINRDGYSPLHLAARYGHTEVVRLIIEHYPSWVHLTNIFGKTAFEMAVIANHTETVSLMLREAAEHIHPICLARSLLFAAKNGNTAIIALLLEAGIDANTRHPSQGTTALHISATEGHDEVITLLMSSGADPWLRTYTTRETALHKALVKEHTECCQALITGIVELMLYKLNLCQQFLDENELEEEGDRETLARQLAEDAKQKFTILCSLPDKQKRLPHSYASEEMLITLSPTRENLPLKKLLSPTIAETYGAMIIEELFLKRVKGKDESL